MASWICKPGRVPRVRVLLASVYFCDHRGSPDRRKHLRLMETPLLLDVTSNKVQGTDEHPQGRASEYEKSPLQGRLLRCERRRRRSVGGGGGVRRGRKSRRTSIKMREVKSSDENRDRGEFGSAADVDLPSPAARRGLVWNWRPQCCTRQSGVGVLAP